MKPICIRNPLPVAAACAWLLAAAWPARADYLSTILAEAPVSYYRFSELGVVTAPYPLSTNLGTVGAAGNANDATSSPEPGVVKGVPGALADPANTAFALPGNFLNRVRVPYRPEWNTPGPFTVEFWAKPASTNFTCPAASVDFNQTPRYGWLFYQSDTALNFGNGWLFRVYKQGGGTATAAINATVINRWWHIVGVYDGVNITLYTNGVQAASSAVSGTYTPNTKPSVELSFGARSDYPLHVLWEFPGSLDEPAFYTNVLSPTQIAAHYEAATSNPAGYAGLVLGNNPAGYWRFDELFAPPVARNSGTAGTALDGSYRYLSTTTPELQAPAFGGFETTNTVLQLHGSGHVRVPPLNFRTNAVTFEGWIKRDGDQADSAGLLSQRSANNGCSLNFKGTSNQLGYQWGNDAEIAQWDSGLVPPDSVWTYVALAVSPSQAALYMYDGTTWSGATNGANHGVLAFTNALQIGWETNGARYFNGLLDETAIFNRTLSANELRGHALAGFGDTRPPVLTTDPPLRTPSGTIYASDAFTLAADAFGVPPLSFQWRKNGADLAGATNFTYVKAAATAEDSGSYDVVVTNPNGSVTNLVPVVVTVMDPVVDINSDLRLWLRFDETFGLWAFDASDYVLDGRLAGLADDTSHWVAGHENGGLRVNPDGSAGNDVVTVPDVDNWLDFSSTLQFTLSAWVNGAPAQEQDAGIVARGFGAGGEQYVLDLKNGFYRFFVQSAGIAPTFLQSAVPPNNDWQHVVAVYSAALQRLKLYVNGVEVASGAPPGNLLQVSHEVSIGSRQSGGAEYDRNFSGLIDEVSIYARALTPREVAALYTLTPAVAPRIVQAPGSQSMFPGGTVSFTVAATGTAPLVYQWKREGADLPNETNATLQFLRVEAAQAGQYSVTVTNLAGSTSAPPVTLTVLTPTPGTYAAQVIADRPEAYWRLNETNAPAILDSMGRHHGTTYAGSTPDDGSHFGFAQTGALAEDADTSIRFTTSSHTRINVPYSPTLNATNFTVECWANLASLPGANTWIAPLASTDGGNVGYALYAGGTSGQWESWFYVGGGFRVGYGTTTQVNDWVHLVMTYDGQTQLFYVDGVPTSSILASFYPNPQRPFFIGAGRNEVAAGEFWFNGWIDEVAYYPTVLTAERISAHYAVGANGPARLTIQRAGGEVELSWPAGTLEWTESLGGTWTPVNGATPPSYRVIPTGTNKFYRVKL
ncbi:MAG: hypothetical protein HZA90_27470 [Verrucomicrobia bacterium]|nr:hypothetical protein [Verrucomicrobiota bacterium]